ncbi:RES domain-containing protein [Skermania sp. ID1734]|uniref:RES family NAD+ phosphorylase n=1 Tax=Skermania sp. ID1734 TaxID=2597516 RepID=UPI00117EF4FE|nr:RES family NAD+ phosphorylase [Skermania sp. ID1734]TSE00435.1 RES domain-containing protein [Skermania sp. ID1734]
MALRANHLSEWSPPCRPAGHRSRAGPRDGPSLVDGAVVTPSPPAPFDPRSATIEPGVRLYRVHTAVERRTATTFNPGFGGATRFAFFGEPIVPVMYAAATQKAAVAETLLHDIPVNGGILPYDRYANSVMSRLEITRPLKVAVLHGLGLRRLKVTATEITASDADTYDRTVEWAQAAHDVGFDGLVWMSRLCNDAKAYVFFGDRCADAFIQDRSFGRLFATGVDQMWLIDLCAPLHVDVLLAR